MGEHLKKIIPHSREHQIHYTKTKKLEYEWALREGKLEAAKHFLRNYNEAVENFKIKIEPVQLKLF